MEFVIIFLAVSMGFLAENIRELYVEKKHEKEYMFSLVRDLDKDVSDINKTTKQIDISIARADTFIVLFKAADYKNSSAGKYFHGKQLGLLNLWRSNDGTTQQLNYAGGLRLIENKMVIDSIQHT